MGRRGRFDKLLKLISYIKWKCSTLGGGGESRTSKIEI